MASHYHIAVALGTITAAKTANAEEFVDSSFLEELTRHVTSTDCLDNGKMGLME